MRRCAVERVHQHLQGLTELASSKTQPKSHENCEAEAEATAASVRTHLEAHRQPVLSGRSFSRPNAPIGRRRNGSLLLE